MGGSRQNGRTEGVPAALESGFARAGIDRQYSILFCRTAARRERRSGRSGLHGNIQGFERGGERFPTFAKDQIIDFTGTGRKVDDLCIQRLLLLDGKEFGSCGHQLGIGCDDYNLILFRTLSFEKIYEAFAQRVGVYDMKLIRIYPRACIFGEKVR